jgi:hypothetical protein
MFAADEFVPMQPTSWPGWRPDIQGIEEQAGVAEREVLSTRQGPLRTECSDDFDAHARKPCQNLAVPFPGHWHLKPRELLIGEDLRHSRR